MCRFKDMGSAAVEDMIEASSGVHFSGFHMDGLEARHIKKPIISTATENMHNQPFVIGEFSNIVLLLLMLFFRCNNDQKLFKIDEKHSMASKHFFNFYFLKKQLPQ